MKWQGTMQPGQMEKFARFLEEHPGFLRELIDEDALVYGFHMGEAARTSVPLLKRMRELAEQRARSENPAPPAACKRRLALGPFLTLFLTLKARQTAEPWLELRSSTVRGSAVFAVQPGGR